MKHCDMSQNFRTGNLSTDCVSDPGTEPNSVPQSQGQLFWF